MSAYLITYDLNQEVTRPKIVQKIKNSFSTWARLSESSYAIVTSQTVEQVYSILKPMIDGNDFIYVINLTKPYTGFGSKEVNDWLEHNLPRLSQSAY